MLLYLSFDKSKIINTNRTVGPCRFEEFVHIKCTLKNSARGAFTNFTVRACGDWGSRCEASATVCAEQGGVGQCFTCEDDLCNAASKVTSLAIFFIVASLLL
ncbi:unnamed protein product [Strongylus vulgaris]|uniref:Uncharacterized protein n=1 Tax=Strongylus vulgaris TaxID=40348 RepID=A0A3P7K7P6_STRVU|nr:unnamed protein product [Strongylus vulgaris]